MESNNKEDTQFLLVTTILLIFTLSIIASTITDKYNSNMDIFGVKMSKETYNGISKTFPLNSQITVCNLQDNKCVVMKKIK